MDGNKLKLSLRVIYILGIAYALVGFFIRKPKENPSVAFVVIGVLILALIIILELRIRRSKNDAKKP